MGKKHTEDREEERTRTEGAGTVRSFLAHRTKPYLPPWIVTGGVGVGGGLAHLQFGNSVGGAVGLTLGSVVLTGITWAAGKVTTPSRRIHTTATVAAASGWLTAAALAGPFQSGLVSTYLIGGPVVAASWNVRRVLRTTEGDAATSEDSFLEKVGLAAKLSRTKVEPNRASGRVELEAGEHSNEDVPKVLGKVASALDVRPEAVRYLPDPDSARRGELVVVPEDMLRTPTFWPGPTAPGGSIGEPVVPGVYEHGEPLIMWFPGDPEEPRNAMHMLVMGMTGSGKSEGLLAALVEVLTRRDVVVWASDAAKGTQTFGPLLPALDWAALDVPSTEAMVTATEAVIPARTTQLAAWGYKQWTPEVYEKHGMPYLIVVISEAAKAIREGADFTGIAQEARSAGVTLVLEMQRASHGQMPTDTRASLGSSWCFGVRDSTDAGFALPDEAVEAGARPEAWKDKKPGYCYVAANGVAEGEWATPARTYRIGIEDLARVAEEFAAVRARLDPVTARAAMEAAPDHYGKADLPAGPVGPSLVKADDMHDEYDQEQEHDAELDGIDPEQEIPPVDEVVQLGHPPADPPRRLSPEEAREAMEELLAEFESEGRTVVGPKDFMEHCERHGRSRGWVSGQVMEMVDAGRLAETTQTGRYRIVPRNRALTPA